MASAYKPHLYNEKRTIFLAASNLRYKEAVQAWNGSEERRVLQPTMKKPKKSKAVDQETKKSEEEPKKSKAVDQETSEPMKPKQAGALILLPLCVCVCVPSCLKLLKILEAQISHGAPLRSLENLCLQYMASTASIFQVCNVDKCGSASFRSMSTLVLGAQQGDGQAYQDRAPSTVGMGVEKQAGDDDLWDGCLGCCICWAQLHVSIQRLCS